MSEPVVRPESQDDKGTRDGGVRSAGRAVAPPAMNNSTTRRTPMPAEATWDDYVAAHGGAKRQAGG